MHILLSCDKYDLYKLSMKHSRYLIIGAARQTQVASMLHFVLLVQVELKEQLQIAVNVVLLFHIKMQQYPSPQAKSQYCV